MTNLLNLSLQSFLSSNSTQGKCTLNPDKDTVMDKVDQTVRSLNLPPNLTSSSALLFTSQIQSNENQTLHPTLIEILEIAKNFQIIIREGQDPIPWQEIAAAYNKKYPEKQIDEIILKSKFQDHEQREKILNSLKKYIVLDDLLQIVKKLGVETLIEPRDQMINLSNIVEKPAVISNSSSSLSNSSTSSSISNSIKAHHDYIIIDDDDSSNENEKGLLKSKKNSKINIQPKKRNYSEQVERINPKKTKIAPKPLILNSSDLYFSSSTTVLSSTSISSSSLTSSSLGSINKKKKTTPSLEEILKIAKECLPKKNDKEILIPWKVITRKYNRDNHDNQIKASTLKSIFVRQQDQIKKSLKKDTFLDDVRDIIKNSKIQFTSDGKIPIAELHKIYNKNTNDCKEYSNFYRSIKKYEGQIKQFISEVNSSLQPNHLSITQVNDPTFLDSSKNSQTIVIDFNTEACSSSSSSISLSSSSSTPDSCTVSSTLSSSSSSSITHSLSKPSSAKANEPDNLFRKIIEIIKEVGLLNIGNSKREVPWFLVSRIYNQRLEEGENPRSFGDLKILLRKKVSTFLKTTTISKDADPQLNVYNFIKNDLLEKRIIEIAKKLKLSPEDRLPWTELANQYLKEYESEITDTLNLKSIIQVKLGNRIANIKDALKKFQELNPTSVSRKSIQRKRKRKAPSGEKNTNHSTTISQITKNTQISDKSKSNELDNLFNEIIKIAEQEKLLSISEPGEFNWEVAVHYYNKAFSDKKMKEEELRAKLETRLESFLIKRNDPTQKISFKKKKAKTTPVTKNAPTEKQINNNFNKQNELNKLFDEIIKIAEQEKLLSINEASEFDWEVAVHYYNKGFPDKKMKEEELKGKLEGLLANYFKNRTEQIPSNKITNKNIQRKTNDDIFNKIIEIGKKHNLFGKPEFSWKIAAEKYNETVTHVAEYLDNYELKARFHGRIAAYQMLDNKTQSTQIPTKKLSKNEVLLNKIIEIGKKHNLFSQPKFSWKIAAEKYNETVSSQEEHLSKNELREKLKNVFRAYLKTINHPSLKKTKKTFEEKTPTLEKLFSEVLEIAKECEKTISGRINWKQIADKYNIKYPKREQQEGKYFKFKFRNKKMEEILKVLKPCVLPKTTNEYSNPIHEISSIKNAKLKERVEIVCKLAETMECDKNGNFPWKDLTIKYNQHYSTEKPLETSHFRSKFRRFKSIIQSKLKTTDSINE